MHERYIRERIEYCLPPPLTNLVGAGFRSPALGRILLVFGDALGVLGVRIAREILQEIKIRAQVSTGLFQTENHFSVLTHLVAVDTCKNLTVSAFVAVVLLDGILFEGFAAGIASEEHHFFSLFGSLSPLSNFHSCTHFSFTCCLQVQLFDLRGSVKMRTFSSPMFWFVKDGEFCESHPWMNRDSPGVGMFNELKIPNNK